MKLSETLAAKKADNDKKIPSNKWAIMERSTKELVDQSLSQNAFQVGDVLPIVTLPDATNKEVNLRAKIQEHDYTVVSFYRGGWCPYCNLELRALQGILPTLQHQNTGLVAITPENPDHSLTTTEKNELSFTVLSDLDNRYAKQLGLVFQLPEDLREVYHSFNLDVPKHNGNQDYELPMPATYIVNNKAEIIYAFVPEDYTKRLDPEEILEVLNEQTITL